MDQRLSLPTLSEMQAEVAHFVERGIPVDQACDFVGLPEIEFRGWYGSSEVIKHLPTPSEIEAMTAAIRNGDLIVSDGSAQRWEAMQQLRDDRQFDLAGKIDEDAYEMPAWWRSGGAVNA